MSLIRLLLITGITGLFMLFSCDNGGTQSRRTSNGKVGINPADMADGGVTASGDAGTDAGGEGSAEADGGEATAEGTGEGTAEGEGDTEGDEVPKIYVADPTLTYVNYARDVIATHCVDCHATTSYPISTYDQVHDLSLQIKTSLINKSMPQGGDLPEEDRTKLIEWILAGATKGPATLQVIEPSVANTPLLVNTFQIKVAIADAYDDGIWNVYYTQDPSDVTSGSAISVNLPVASQATYDWDTSSLPNGTFYIYVTVPDENGDVVAKAVGSLVKGPYIKMDPVWKAGNVAYQQPVNLPFTSFNATGAGPYLVKVEAKIGAMGAYAEWDAGSADLANYNISGQAESTDYYFRISLLENGVVVSTDVSDGPVALADEFYVYTYTNLRTDLFAPSCDACHAMGAPQAALFRSDLYDVALGAGPNRKGPLAVQRINAASGPMPPGGGLSDTIKLRAKLWLMLGGPE